MFSDAYQKNGYASIISRLRDSNTLRDTPHIGTFRYASGYALHNSIYFISAKTFYKTETIQHAYRRVRYAAMFAVNAKLGRNEDFAALASALAPVSIQLAPCLGVGDDAQVDTDH